MLWCLIAAALPAACRSAGCVTGWRSGAQPMQGALGPERPCIGRLFFAGSRTTLCRKPYNRRQRYRPGSVSVLRCWCSLRTTGWLLGAVRSSRTRCGGGPVPRLPRDDALPRGARRHGGGARGWGSCQSVGRARRTSDHESHKSRRPCRWRPPRNAISGAPCQRWYHALVGRFTMAPAKLELTQPDLDRPGCSHLGNSNVSMPRAAPHPSRLRGQHT